MSIALKYRSASGEHIRWRSRLLYPVWRLLQCDFALRRASGVLVLNREDLAFCRSRYGRRDADIRLFRNGVYPSKLEETSSPAGVPTILFLGSWLPRKGCKTLVEAGEILDRHGKDVHWLLAGTGGTREDVLGAWPRHLRKRVEVIPSFEPSHEESLFARATLFVLPSFFEGQPLALLQAMASGLCTIASNTCGQRDLIEHGINGLLHAPGEATSLADHIEACLADPEWRLFLARNAKRSVQLREWKTVAAEVVDFVEEVHARWHHGV